MIRRTEQENDDGAQQCAQSRQSIQHSWSTHHCSVEKIVESCSVLYPFAQFLRKSALSQSKTQSLFHSGARYHLGFVVCSSYVMDLGFLPVVVPVTLGSVRLHLPLWLHTSPMLSSGDWHAVRFLALHGLVVATEQCCKSLTATRSWGIWKDWNYGQEIPHVARRAVAAPGTGLFHFLLLVLICLCAVNGRSLC